MAMCMIMIHHFIHHALHLSLVHPIIYKLVTPFFFCGVNLFFLISGWFGIKCSLKSIWNLCFIVLAFSVVNFLLCLAAGCPVSGDTWLNEFLFPVSFSHYWFLKVYLALIIVAPLVNKGLDSLTVPQLRWLMAALTIFNIYSCPFGHNLTNADGYSFMQGLFMYTVARYLTLDKTLLQWLRNRPALLFYFLFLIVDAGLSLRWNMEGIHAYNSVFVVGASLSLFVYLSSQPINSNAINYIATGALGCYLLQDGIFGEKFFYPFIGECLGGKNVFVITAAFILLITVFWIVSLGLSFVVDRLKIALYGKIERHLPHAVKSTTF